MRITRTNIANVAERQGCTVTVVGKAKLQIWMRRGSVAVVQAEDGSMHRGDVRLDLAKAMSVAEAVKALKLQPKD